MEWHQFPEKPDKKDNLSQPFIVYERSEWNLNGKIYKSSCLSFAMYYAEEECFVIVADDIPDRTYEGEAFTSEVWWAKIDSFPEERITEIIMSDVLPEEDGDDHLPFDDYYYPEAEDTDREQYYMRW